jgi:hypothetical protein
VLAVAPTLVLPILSPAVGDSYGVGDAIIHGACLFVAGSVFFSADVCAVHRMRRAGARDDR